jgi:hypothetical protein
MGKARKAGKMITWSKQTIFTFKGVSLYAPLIVHPRTVFLERLAAGGLPDELTAITTTSSAAVLMEQSGKRWWKGKAMARFQK